MRGRSTGTLIGAAFGLIYVVVNAGPLPTAASLPLRLAGVVAFLAVLVALHRSRARATTETTRATTSDSDPPPPHSGFGRGYWLVVAAEFVALAAGLALLNGPIDAPRAGVGWVSLVVGVHFFGLAAVFGLRFFHWLGAAIATCGAVGLVLVAVGVGTAPVAVISGILPGALLLGFGWWGAVSGP